MQLLEARQRGDLVDGVDGTTRMDLELLEVRQPLEAAQRAQLGEVAQAQGSQRGQRVHAFQGRERSVEERQYFEIDQIRNGADVSAPIAIDVKVLQGRAREDRFRSLAPVQGTHFELREGR